MSFDPPSHGELASTLASLRLGIDASDLHGSLSGYLCAGGRAGAQGWAEALRLDVDAAVLERNEVLQRLYLSCVEQFEGPCADVTPLLPDAPAPLSQRTAGLIEWCRGFLGGCGLAGAGSQRSLSTEATGILADFNTIASTRVDAEADDNSEDEQAFGDVLDFVRTAAALLHREVQGGARGSHSLH